MTHPQLNPAKEVGVQPTSPVKDRRKRRSSKHGMTLSEQRKTIMNILYFDLDNEAKASEIAKKYLEKFGRKPGNVYEILNDLGEFGYVERLRKFKRYALTTEGKIKLRIKEPTHLELLRLGFRMNQVEVGAELYDAIKKTAERDGQNVSDWVVEILEMATGIKKNGEV